MTWVKIDDAFSEHPKMAAVGPVGWGVWLAGLAYCNRNLTDGFIPRAIADGIGGSWTIEEQYDSEVVVWQLERGRMTSDVTGYGRNLDAVWIVGILVQYGLWDEVDGGYRVHDFADYQPTKAEVLAARAKKVKAGRAGARARIARLSVAKSSTDEASA